MTQNITQKIIETHHVEGELTAGSEIALKIDQTLTQDATGTMAYLQLESINVPWVKTELSVSYVDHNTLQGDFRNADDHRYLQTVAAKHGVVFSRPGNGICHQLHIERFARPGKTLIGSDSHTPTAGGIGSMAMGAGGLDVASAMAGMPFRIKYPKVMGIELTGKLQKWVSAKDVILEVLRHTDVKGGVGYVLEYFGEGVKTLTVPDRATITNMGTETGCTTSIFPSDEITKAFMEAENRADQWIELKADEGATYDEILKINLSEVEPLAACPHSPGLIKTVKELSGMPVNQVGIGSCTNSSYRDLKISAEILKDKTISEKLHLVMNPGSRQVVSHLIKELSLNDLIASGARILENACGACIGMGAAPSTDAVSVRTYNRNFLGRSGTKSAQVYLVSPETAAATALTGVFTDPRTLNMEYPEIAFPDKFDLNDNMFIFPPSPEDAKNITIERGPNIAPLPSFNPLEDVLGGKVILKVEDNITTDHIMPAGAKILPLRSNIPEISKYVFEVVDPKFPDRALENGGGFIVGGDNYGQGSSREHAALAPKYLGISAVIVKSFARIHLANLVNFGIVPLTFKNPSDYDKIEQGDELSLEIGDLTSEVTMTNKSKNFTAVLQHSLSLLDSQILKAGGKLPWVKKQI
ncbi:MAG: aconitate hydratase [Deltaproteobacteria bacterium]|nr:aconitate hydratase [Deltaproteobacteria bacterium]